MTLLREDTAAGLAVERDGERLRVRGMTNAPTGSRSADRRVVQQRSEAGSEVHVEDLSIRTRDQP